MSRNNPNLLMSSLYKTIQATFLTLFFTYAFAGFDEDFLMGYIWSYALYCEDMSSEGLDGYSAYVLKYSETIDKMKESEGFKLALKMGNDGLEDQSFRPTACSQMKKGLIKKDAYWLFE